MRDNDRVTDKFVFFTSGILSNWYPCTFTVSDLYGVFEFNCAEQFMMVEKALNFGDWLTGAKILGEINPAIQEKLGRSVRGFNADKWRHICADRFYPGLLAKFEQNKECKEYLLNTGQKTLVEATPWDSIWGIGMDIDDPDIEDPTKWKGDNLLGKCLMRVRKELRKYDHSD